MTQAKQANSAGFNSAWTMEGPGNIGGRINCVAIHPNNNLIVYVGNASGGIHKTTDGGVTWNPIFDNQSALAISCIEFEPGNPNTLWVGTGDAQISGYPFIGDGIYKSTDDGNTWSAVTLAANATAIRTIASAGNHVVVPSNGKMYLAIQNEK